jgi:hypothetical protein
MKLNAANMKERILQVLDVLEPVGDKVPEDIIESISSGEFFEDYEGNYDDKSLLEYSKSKISELMKNNEYVDEVTEVFSCKKNYSKIGDKLIGIAEEFEKAGLPENFVDKVLSGEAFEELDPKSFDKDDLVDWLDKYLDKKNWKNKESIVNKFKNSKNNFAVTDSDVAILVDRLADIIGTTSDKLDIVSDIISAPKVFKSGAMSLIVKDKDNGMRYFVSQYLPAVSSLNYKKYDTAIHITSEDGMNEYYAFKDGKSVNYSFNSKNFSSPDYRPYVVNDYGSSKFNKFLAEVGVKAIPEDKHTYFEVNNPDQNKNLMDTAKKYDVKVIYPGDFSIKDGSGMTNNFSRRTITDKELMSKYEEYLKTHNDNEGVADYFADEFNLKDDEVDELVDRLTEIIIPDNFNSPVRFSSYKLKNPRINY